MSLSSKVDAVKGGLGWWVCCGGFRGVKAGRVDPKEESSLVSGVERVECDMAIYCNRGVYLEFLDERMKFTSATSINKNILQSCLFIQLGCVQFAAVARLF